MIKIKNVFEKKRLEYNVTVSPASLQHLLPLNKIDCGIIIVERETLVHFYPRIRIIGFRTIGHQIFSRLQAGGGSFLSSLLTLCYSSLRTVPISHCL